MSKLHKTEKITINGADVTVRTSVGSALRQIVEMKRQMILATGAEDEDGYFTIPAWISGAYDAYLIILFTAHKVKGDLGFALPSTMDSIEAIVKGFHAIDEGVSPDDFTLWTQAAQRVNAPPGDPMIIPESIEKN